MTTMKNIYVIILAIVLTIGTASAQQSGDRSERMEAFKISFFTEQLDLSPDEAKVFWPVFNQFQKERQSLRQQYKSRAGASKQGLADLSDAEAESLINNEMAFQANNLDITKKYVGEFKKILPTKKVAVLLTLENKFKRMILQKVKEGGGR